MKELKAPFPYFGGKSKVADKAWEEFGHDVKHYIEPFVDLRLYYCKGPVVLKIISMKRSMTKMVL